MLLCSVDLLVLLALLLSGAHGDCIEVELRLVGQVHWFPGRWVVWADFVRLSLFLNLPYLRQLPDALNSGHRLVLQVYRVTEDLPLRRVRVHRAQVVQLVHICLNEALDLVVRLRSVSQLASVVVREACFVVVLLLL